MRAAAIQFFATPFALERNLQTAERLVRAAAAQGARLVVLPELFNTGYVYTPRLCAAAETDGGPTLRWMTALSRELEIIVGGALLLREGNHIFDAFALIEPNGKSHRYRKRHPFVWEHCYFESGREPLVVETGFGRIGLLICWDIAFRSAWEAYRGKVDLILAASAPPQFHRSVLNFPAAHKVYVAKLLPDLARYRAEIDAWYVDGARRGAAFVGAPVIHSVMAGRFVTAIPFPRLSFGLAALSRLKYLSWTGQAAQATLRATFFGCSAVFDSRGEILAAARAGEEGIAAADLLVQGDSGAAPASPESEAPDASAYFLTHIPGQLRALEILFRWLGHYYRNYLAWEKKPKK